MLAIIPNPIFNLKSQIQAKSSSSNHQRGHGVDLRHACVVQSPGSREDGFRIQDLRFTAGLRVQGFVIQVQGLGFKGSGSRVYRLLRSTALGFRGQCCHNSMSLVSQLCEPVDTAQSLVSTTPVSTQS